jgi:uncharacterized protein
MYATIERHRRMDIVFEWDENKAQTNLHKHKISFKEAVTVFHDPLVATIPDPDHSDEEDRFIAIGYSNRNRLLVVSFTERDNKTRIINCRKAEPVEREIYEEA